jgi:SAM-dependent methyltransferase
VNAEDPNQPRCCFDDWVGHWEDRTEKHPNAAKVTEHLLDALEEAGVRGRSVLDLGCGIGDVAIETVRRGAVRADGFDLSAKAIDEARKLAGARGVADRTSFTVGDGAAVELPTSDVVVLNRVFCCYPDVEQLLERSLASATAVYAFTVPPSRGFAGRLARGMTWVSNRYYAIRERKFAGFRVFIHDVDRIEARVRAAGFRPVRRERVRLSWELAVFAR